MQEEFYNCSLCRKNYDLEAQIPKTLVCCYHDICLACLKSLFPNNPVEELTCPICKQNLLSTILTPESFETSPSLLEILRNRTKKRNGYCEKHDGKKKKLFCITDQLPICTDCVVFGEHKTHEIKKIEDLLENAKKKKRKLESLLEGYDAKSKNINESLNERNQQIQETIKNRFCEMRRIMAAREQDIIEKVQDLLKVQKDVLAWKLEESKNQLRAQISEISFQHNFESQTFSSIMRELDAADNELSNFGVEETGRFAEAGFEVSRLLERFERVVARLDETWTQTVENDTSTEEEDAAKIKKEASISPVRSQLIKIFEESDYENIEDCLLVKEKDSGDGDEMEEEIEEDNEVESFLIRQGEKVKIDFSKKEFTAEELTDICSKFELNNQKIRHLNMNFAGSSLKDDHLEVLEQNIFQKNALCELESFVFDCSNTSIGDPFFAVLKDIMSLLADTLEKVEIILDSTDIEGNHIFDVFANMNRLQHLKLSFEESAISSAGISFLLSNLRPIACNLENLDLNFNATGINDVCLRILIKDVLLLMKNPKYLRIFLGNTNLSNNLMLKLFQNLKRQATHLRTFELDLRNTGLYNAAIRCLFIDPLKEMLILENLKLDLSGAKMINDTLKHLSFASCKLKSLSLGLNATSITDEGLEVLKKSIAGTKIERVEVQLEKTSVSDECLDRFGDYLRKRNVNQQTTQNKTLKLEPKKEDSAERDLLSVFQRETTSQTKTHYSYSKDSNVSPQIKEKMLLDLKTAIIAKTDDKLKPEEISISELLMVIENMKLEIYNEVLKKVLTKYISSFIDEGKNLKVWRRRIRIWLCGLISPNHWITWLVANGKFSLFREKLIEVLKSLSSRNLVDFRQKAQAALTGILLNGENPKEIPIILKNSCSQKWWMAFMARDPDLKDLWESITRKNPLF